VEVTFSLKAASFARAVVLVSAGAATGGCGDVNAALAQQSEARHLSADLLVQFTKAVDAANRAVMADTDEASVAFAREAEQAKREVQNRVDLLGPILEGLQYSEESQLLNEFASVFATYRELDQRILDMAVENTNLKAERLSFGRAQDAADSLQQALGAIAPATAADRWHVEALAATAVARVREIQALQAPHIADPDDASMTRLESRMASAEAAARSAIAALAPLVQSASRPRLAAATAALDQFLTLNAEIVVLSRRNTNVRSLALTLDQKRKLVAPCEKSLQALRDALARRGYPAGRT
jgi:hypothetical protein